MLLCAKAETNECPLHENGIPFPPAEEELARVREIIHECEALESLEEGVKCPFKEWVLDNEEDGEEYDASRAEAEVAEATTIPELIEVESKVAAAIENAEDATEWASVLSESIQRMKALAEEQGLEEITDSFTDTPQVTESEDGRLLVTGTFARVNIPTKNGRVYPQSVWDANSEHVENMLTTGKLVGQDTHPFFGGTKLSEVNIVFRNVWQDGDRMRYEAIIPNTRAGEDLRELLDCGVAVELSTRGFGSLKEGEWDGEDCVVVQDDYRLHAIDTVMDGAAQDTSITTAESRESVGAEETTESIEESAQHTKERDTTMRKRVKRMLEAAIRTAGVLGLDEQVEALRAKLDALDAVETDEGEEFDEAIEAGMAAVDEASEVFEKAEDDEKPVDGAADNTAVDEAISRLEALERKAQEREANEKRIAERDAKVEALMAEAEDLSEKYEARLRVALSEQNTAAEVERTYNSLLPVMQDASAAVENATPAVHIRHRENETTTLTGERRERPDTVDEVIDQLCEGLVNESRFVDTGEDSPSNMVRNFRMIVQNYHKEHPAYLRSMTREGYKRWQSIRENTDTDDIAVGAPYILPIFRRTFPKLIATEICSVQPIDRPDAKAFFLNPVTDSGGARLDVESNFDSTYADHTEASANADVKLTVTSASIAATSKSLEATWTTELAQDLQAYHNLNAESELMQVASDEIAREINYTLLEDMRSNATGASRTYKTTKPSSSNYTGREWDQRLADFISRASGDIAGKVYRRPNWIVCDPETSSRFTALNTFESARPDEMNTFSLGVTYEGVLSNRWKVYSDAWFTSSTIMLGYKGTDWKDTGYIYLPYIPAYVSPQQYDTDTLEASRAILTRFGKYMVNADMFGLVTVESGTATDLV